LPADFEWLSDNGNCQIACETRRFAREMGLELRTMNDTHRKSPEQWDG
jgi:hypothetical protein